MNKFAAVELCSMLDQLQQQEQSFRLLTDIHQSTDPLEEDQLDRAKQFAKRVTLLSERLHFPSALQKSANTELYLASNLPSAPALEVEFRNLKEALLDDVKTHSYLYVKQTRAKYVDSPALFGNEVFRAFPEARPDVKEAGNCLAAECNTAAVFHLMRVVEWGLRALCSHLGLHRARRPKKSGQKSFIPLTYADWETLLNQLQPKVDARIAGLRRGSEAFRSGILLSNTSRSSRDT